MGPFSPVMPVGWAGGSVVAAVRAGAGDGHGLLLHPAGAVLGPHRHRAARRRRAAGEDRRRRVFRRQQRAGRVVARAPAEIARREERLKVIQAARERIESRQREADLAKGRSEDDDRIPRDKNGKPKNGNRYKRDFGVPEDSAQENFTDPDSRIMKRAGGGFDQCYNGQTAVDANAQIIVAAELSNCAADSVQLPAMLAAVDANLGAALEIPHLARVPRGEPALEGVGGRGGAEGRDPREVEAEAEGLRLDAMLQRRGRGLCVHGLRTAQRAYRSSSFAVGMASASPYWR